MSRFYYLLIILFIIFFGLTYRETYKIKCSLGLLDFIREQIVGNGVIYFCKKRAWLRGAHFY